MADRKSLLRIGFVIILGLGLAFSYWNRDDARRIQLGQTIVKVELAESGSELTRGLSGRRSICGDCGMLFVFSEPNIQHFWMKDMVFSLDMVFLRGQKVVEVVEDVPPPFPGGAQIPTVISSQEADMVLEVNAGFVRKKGIQLGDEVRFLGR